MRKRYGDSGQPWRIPALASSLVLCFPAAATVNCGEVYMILMRAVRCGGTPQRVSAVRRASGCILSNAFSQSSKMVYSDCAVASARSMRRPIMWIGRDVERAALNPDWVSLSLSSRAAWSLV